MTSKNYSFPKGITHLTKLYTYVNEKSTVRGELFENKEGKFVTKKVKKISLRLVYDPMER